MLHVLQYLVGTSMAAVPGIWDFTLIQSVVGGPRARGSSDEGGGCGWRFRGRIPGSVTEAWMKEDVQMKKR